MVVVLAAAGGLAFLLGISIYSALVLAKKTDRMVLEAETDEDAVLAMTVRFPDEVFQPKGPAFDRR